MKTLMISVLMVLATLQQSYANDTSSSDEIDTTPVQIIREVR